MAVTVRRTIELDRGIEEVFAYLADFTHTQEWDPGTVTTTRVDDGPLGVGARFHNVSEFRGKQTELEYELQVHEPWNHLVFEGNNKTVTSTDDMRLSGDATHTTLTYEATLEFKGLAKLAGPFLKKGFEGVADDTAAQLRSVLA